MNGWAIFLLVLLIVLAFGFGGYTVHNQFRARRLGLPTPPLNPFAHRNRSNNASYIPPAPAPSGILSFLKSKMAALTNTRTRTTGGYESTSYDSARRGRGFGALDPDEAWDTRVGNEADYGVPQPGYDQDSTELRDTDGPYNRPGQGIHSQGELDDRYDEEMGRRPRGQQGHAQDPFGDAAERSDLRGMSPRPVEGHDRRSAFREAM